MVAALDPLSAAALRPWTPVRVSTMGAEPVVEWAVFDAPLHEPFFEQSADRAMAHPFNLLFGLRTPIADAEALRADDAGLSPRAFVFHMSRCGSTLVAQMLSRLDATIVLSEAQPLDALLRLRGSRGVDDATVIRWLRAVLSALGRPRAGERHLFVKFHAWHAVHIPLLTRAFPGVPCVFVFREPGAVLQSQSRSPGAEVVPGVIDPSSFGLSMQDALELPPDAYAAHAIAAFCDTALAASGGVLFVDYAELPDAVFSRVLPFCGVRPADAEVDRMRAIAAADTKVAGSAFAGRPQQPPLAGGSLAPGRLTQLYAALMTRAAAAR